jgi:hypothetical protein
MAAMGLKAQFRPLSTRFVVIWLKKTKKHGISELNDARYIKD